MGGGLQLKTVFDEAHQKVELAQQRDFLRKLLSEELSTPSLIVSAIDLEKSFPTCFKRLPAIGFRAYTSLQRTLLADVELSLNETVPDRADVTGVVTWAQIRVWQIDPIL